MEVSAANNANSFSAVQSTLAQANRRTQEPLAEETSSESAVEVASRAIEDAARAEIDKASFAELISGLNEQAKMLRMQLRFGYSEDINSLYLTVMDAKSGELVRQIPSEEAIKLIARMREVAGLLLEERV